MHQNLIFRFKEMYKGSRNVINSGIVWKQYSSRVTGLLYYFNDLVINCYYYINCNCITAFLV